MPPVWLVMIQHCSLYCSVSSTAGDKPGQPKRTSPTQVDTRLSRLTLRRRTAGTRPPDVLPSLGQPLGSLTPTQGSGVLIVHQDRLRSEQENRSPSSNQSQPPITSSGDFHGPLSSFCRVSVFVVFDPPTGSPTERTVYVPGLCERPHLDGTHTGFRLN